MACCLTAPSHYLNQCWLIIIEVSDNHPRAISQEIPPPSITKITLKFTYITFHYDLPRVNELNSTHWGLNKVADILQTFLIFLVQFITFWWFGARLQYILCISNGDTAILCCAIDLTLYTEILVKSPWNYVWLPEPMLTVFQMKPWKNL